MARWTGQPQAPIVLDAAERWKRGCLLRSGSVFTNEQLWTAENLSQLRRSVVENPLVGAESFYAKLEKQLAGAPPQIAQLAAEVFWFLVLLSHESHFSAAVKRERISTIWQLSGTPIPQSEMLSDDVLSGIATPGIAFNTMLHEELAYALHVFLDFKARSADEQTAMLSSDDVWELCQFVTSVRGGEIRSFRHMLLFFCFPNSFERITSRDHKRRIYEAFKDRLGGADDAYVQDRSPCGTRSGAARDPAEARRRVQHRSIGLLRAASTAALVPREETTREEEGIAG